MLGLYSYGYNVICFMLEVRDKDRERYPMGTDVHSSKFIFRNYSYIPHR